VVERGKVNVCGVLNASSGVVPKRLSDHVVIVTSSPLCLIPATLALTEIDSKAGLEKPGYL